MCAEPARLSTCLPSRRVPACMPAPGTFGRAQQPDLVWGVGGNGEGGGAVAGGARFWTWGAQSRWVRPNVGVAVAGIRAAAPSWGQPVLHPQTPTHHTDPARHSEAFPSTTVLLGRDGRLG